MFIFAIISLCSGWSILSVALTSGGFHATFDGPARSVRCAASIRESTRRLGLNVRIGIHTGECEVRGESLEGVAIHMAARVSGMAAGGDILVSRARELSLKISVLMN